MGNNDNNEENEAQNGSHKMGIVIILTTIGWGLTAAILYVLTFGGAYNLQLIMCFWTLGGFASGCILYLLLRILPPDGRHSPWLIVGSAIGSTVGGIIFWNLWKGTIFKSTDDLQVFLFGGICLVLPIIVGTIIGSMLIAAQILFLRYRANR